MESREFLHFPATHNPALKTRQSRKGSPAEQGPGGAGQGFDSGVLGFRFSLSATATLTAER